MLARLRRAWPFVVLLLLVYLCGLGRLRFLLDDWCQVPRLAAFLRGEDGGWVRVLDNSWTGNPRVFFLTWLLQGVFARVWGLTTPVPYFLLNFGAHLASCLLIARLLRRAGLHERYASLAGLFALVMPACGGALYWINCWQFVLPFAAWLLVVELYTRPRGGPAADLAALTAAALTAQFLGEQVLPALYATFALAALAGPKRRAWVPALVCAAAFVLYWRAYAAPWVKPGPGWSWSAAWDGARAMLGLHAASLWPRGSFYGGAGAPAPSAGTLALAAAAAAAFGARFLSESPPEGKKVPPETPAWRFVAGAAAFAVLCALPVLYGVGMSLRSMEGRYAYPTGLALGVGLAALLRAAAGRRPGSARAGLAAVAVGAWLSGLSVYALRDVWGGQKRLDDRIWAAVEGAYRPGLEVLVTDSLQDAVLMPLRSSAISDFGEDFGIKCRAKERWGASLLPLRRWSPARDHGDWVELRGYREGAYRVPVSRALPLVFRYPLTRRFSELLDGQVRAFPDFEAYKRFRAQEPYEFPP